jgi:hypothetical protein
MLANEVPIEAIHPGTVVKAQWQRLPPVVAKAQSKER